MEKVPNDPSLWLRRSPLWRQQQAAGARFVEVDGGLAVEAYAPPAQERSQAERLGLADLSLLPRLGFRGEGALSWLRAQGLSFGEESNRAWRQEGGAWALRLSPGEILLLEDPATCYRPGGEARLADLLRAWGKESASLAGGYLLPRQDSHLWFFLCGREAPACLAKLCSVDLRPRHFSEGQVAQSWLAEIGAILLRARGLWPAYHLLADSASAAYLWEVLLDAMVEFDGKPIGLGAVAGLS